LTEHKVDILDRLPDKTIGRGGSNFVRE